MKNDMNKMTEEQTDAVDTSGKKKGQTEEEPLNVKKEVISWIKTLAIVVVVVIVITQVIIINARIPSGSMESTIMTGDRVIGFRFSYWFDKDPERGDIVLFKYPVDEDQIYIKRVIGLPGETIDIRDGKIYIDGSDTPLDEPYLNEEWVWENDGFSYEVPEGCYFVLGDNRNNSEDARFWARDAISAGVASDAEDASKYTYVTHDQLLAKAIFKYYKGFAWLYNTSGGYGADSDSSAE